MVRDSIVWASPAQLGYWEPIPTYVVEAQWRTMRVDDLLRKTVVFVGVEAHGRFTPNGTGFICNVPFGDVSFYFVATAAHVVHPRWDHIAIRLNRKDGGCSTVRLQNGGLRHPDPALDVALLPISITGDIFDFVTVPIDRAHWKEVRERLWPDPGLGDEVTITGLYTSHYGYQKNIPIVRIGNIAAMPDEKVQAHSGYLSAYLIEVRSLAGISGSPVYLNVPQVRVHEGQIQTLSGREYIPIGVLIGRHLSTAPQDDIPVPQFQASQPQSDEYATRQEGTGLAVVTPIEALYEIVEAPEVRRHLEEVVRQHRQKSDAQPLAASPTEHRTAQADEPEAENPDHLEDFNRLLSAAVKSPKSGG